MLTIIRLHLDIFYFETLPIVNLIIKSTAQFTFFTSLENILLMKLLYYEVVNIH
jgi:hypothetical protein